MLPMLIAACSGGDEPAPAPKEPGSTSGAVSSEAAAPAAVELGSGDAVQGKALYTQNCATCHGRSGGGDGVLSASLDPRPAAHNDGSYMNPLSDDHLFTVIKEGGASVGKSILMAPWSGTLSDAEIVDVIAFIRTLANPPDSGS
jgi:mono/diheme cytochrome c family protein